MLLVAICTGLRASEILSLKWEDFDFANLKMRVVRSVVRGIVDRCKTETSESDLPLDPTFAAELLEWQKQCAPSAEGWLFPSPRTGRPYELNLQQKVLRPAGEKLGIPNLGFHTFRHSLATCLMDEQENPAVVQAIMRHSKMDMTLYYSHSRRSAKRAAQEKVVQRLVVPAAATEMRVPMRVPGTVQ